MLLLAACNINGYPANLQRRLSMCEDIGVINQQVELSPGRQKVKQACQFDALRAATARPVFPS